MTLQEAIAIQVIQQSIKDTGYIINQSNVAEYYKNIIDSVGGKNIWYFYQYHIDNLPNLIPFFKEKKYSILITLCDHSYHTGIYDSYQDETRWVLKDSGIQKRNNHVELLNSLGFEKVPDIYFGFILML